MRRNIKDGSHEPTFNFIHFMENADYWKYFRTWKIILVHEFVNILQKLIVIDAWTTAPLSKLT
jgi:hypothetical protein